MSKSVKIAISFLLFMISGVFLFMIGADNIDEARKPAIFLFPAIPAVIGLALLLSGLFWKVGDQFKHVITKKATPSNLYIGLGVVIASIGILYLFNNVLHFAPLFVVVGALLGVPIGVMIMGSIYSEACVGCRSVLSTESKILKEVNFRGELPVGAVFKDNDVLSFSFCPSCNSFIKIKCGKNAYLVEGAQARRIHSYLAGGSHDNS
jgi:hypothetical protein